MIRPAETYLTKWNGPGGISSKKDAIKPPTMLILVLDKWDNKNVGVINKIISHGHLPIRVYEEICEMF